LKIYSIRISKNFDKGTKYDSQIWNENEIIHETTAPYSFEMNGKGKKL
jgi:hypothetical protein